MNLDLQLLRCFSRIAELGSLTRASSDLGISQPALTRQMLRLEHDLGVTLLVRDSRGVSLTEAGEQVLTRIQPLIEQARQIQEELSASRGKHSGAVAIGMPTSLHRSVTCPLVEEIRRARPGIHLRIIDGLDTLLHDQLRDGLVDLGVMIHDPNRAIVGVEQKPLAREALLLIGPKGRFAAGKSIRPSDMALLPLVLPGSRNTLRHRIDALLARTGVQADLQLEVDSLTLAFDLVRQGDTFTVAPRSAIEAGLAGDVDAWEIEGATIVWACCTQQKRQLSPPVRIVAERLEGLIRARHDARPGHMD